MNHLPEILLSNLFLILIWAFSELFIKNTRNFNANRFFLLAGSILAALLPWLPWQVRIPLPIEAFPFIPAATVGETLAFDPTPVVESVALPSGTPVNWLALIYFSVVGIMLTTFLAQAVRMFLWTHRRPVTRWDRYRVVEMNKSWPAFSFFRTIYYPEPFEPDKRETITILEHERVHARQLHSIDNLLLLVIRILFFYNPAVHLLAGRLRLTHEFLADAATAGANKAEYSQTLIRHQFLVPRLLLMHSFNNQSFLKRRLNMLMKSNTRRRAAWIYLLAVPLLAGMFLLSGWSASAEKETFIAAKKQGEDLVLEKYQDKPQDADKKVKACDEMPEFQGGSFMDFNKWVLENLKVNLPALEKSVKGIVYVSFVVSSKGKVQKVKLKQGIENELDNAVLKVVGSSPDWKPGKYKGKVVDVPLTIPVSFVYNKSAEDVQDAKIGAASHLPAVGKVFLIVEEMPTFQGGTIDNFRNWVQTNVKYPKLAREKRISGTEYVSFIVDTTGRVVDPQIIRSADPILDAEIMRVLCSAPLWKPGKQRGQLVNVSFSIPVKFILDGQAGDQLTKDSVGGENQKREGQQVPSTLNGVVTTIGEVLDRQGNAVYVDGVRVTEADMKVFLIVEEMPEFQGGSLAKFQGWAQAMVRYPQKAMEENKSGTVEVSFTVNKKGEVEDVTIEKSADPFLDEEVLRVVKSSPAWKPGKQRGKLVKVSQTIPVKFILN